MNSVHEISSILNQYQPALIALTVLCLSVMIQSLLIVPFAFLTGEQQPGLPIKGDHKLLSFRVIRTHLNSVENLAPFVTIVLIAVLIGANASLTNWLAIIHVSFRIIFWAVYYSGKGKVSGGIRTLCFICGYLPKLILSVVVLMTLVH